ncbi:hypothetical protein LCGC14_2066440 [marine sediment metagenome]|uniref:DUF2188 domain-containing protein n=1 Tax=marine sediment metagenome TaxID=412755 RepID=A0A0F9EJN3_9ZZZZ
MSQHIIKHINGGWAIKRRAASKATQVFDTQKTAIKHGRILARKQHCDLYIHRPDGRVRQKLSYLHQIHK